MVQTVTADTRQRLRNLQVLLGLTGDMEKVYKTAMTKDEYGDVFGASFYDEVVWYQQRIVEDQLIVAGHSFVMELREEAEFQEDLLMQVTQLSPNSTFALTAPLITY